MNRAAKKEPTPAVSVWLVEEMFRAGKDTRQIADELKLSEAVVYNHLARRGGGHGRS